MSSSTLLHPACVSRGPLQVVLELWGWKNHQRPSCQPPLSQITLQMETPRARGMERLAQSHKAISGLKSMIPFVLRISPRRSVLFSLGPVLLSHPRGVGLWLLGIHKFYPLNFCPADLSAMHIGSGCSPA